VKAGGWSGCWIAGEADLAMVVITDREHRSIGGALAIRANTADLSAGGDVKGGPASLTKADRS
jgi:hypothetical protein